MLKKAKKLKQNKTKKTQKEIWGFPTERVWKLHVYFARFIQNSIYVY